VRCDLVILIQYFYFLFSQDQEAKLLKSLDMFNEDGAENEEKITFSIHQFGDILRYSTHLSPSPHDLEVLFKECSKGGEMTS